MGNCELNEELAEKVAEFLLKIPDEVWDELFDQLPEFQKMPEEFKNWPFGKQAVVLMMGAVNDYWIGSEIHWNQFYKKIQTSFPVEPNSANDLANLYDPDSRISTRIQKFLKLADKLWEKDEDYFKENIELIWDELADVMGQCKEDKTIALAMKDLVILLTKREKNNSSLFQIELPILVDKRIIALTKTIGNCTEDEVGRYRMQKFWNTVLKKLNNLREQLGKSPLTMAHLDTLLWSKGEELFREF